MKFSDRILKRLEDPPVGFSFQFLKNWIAENPSRYSAMEKRVDRSWLPHYRSARECEYILFLGLFLPPWESWEVVARIRESCYFHRYTGEWKQVQECLEQVTDLDTFEKKLQTLMSLDDFFGNFLMEVERYLRRERFAFKPFERDRNKPRRLIRHRGYRDKGSLRPYHQRGRNLPEESPSEDRRGKVQYRNLPDI